MHQPGETDTDVDKKLLRVYYTNAGGLYGKLSELRIFIDSNNIDIVCVTETHFHDELEEAEIEIPGFKFVGNRNFKLDRTSSKLVETSSKGGSIIYIRNCIPIVEGSYDRGPDSVSVVIDSDVGKILIGCFYRSMSLNNSQNSDFLNFFASKISGNDDLEKVLFGDFNCPDVSWISGNVVGPDKSVNKSLLFQEDLLDCVHNVGLEWLITDEITRRRKVGNNIQESTIDQVFYTDDSLISEFKINNPLGKSDHVSIVIELNVFSPDKPRCNNIDDIKRNWSKVTLQDILDLSNGQNWEYSRNLDDMSVEEVIEEISGKLSNITGQIPQVASEISSKIESRSKNENYNMPWITSAIKRAVKSKNKAWAVFDACPSTNNLSSALHKQKIVDDVELKSKLKYEKLITSNLKHNSKAFYSYLRNRRNVKSVVTALKNDKQLGSLTKSDFETAEYFASAFSSVFVHEPYGPLPQHCYKNYTDSIGKLVITEEDVYNELKSINIFKSFGPDNIHPKLLRGLADSPSFVKALTDLYKKCISDCKIPKIWKLANVIALHKKDSKLDPLNYRPVSLTCILCKIYEKFLRRHILEFVKDKINSNQHGFVENRSCFSNLLETIDAVMDMLESGCPVDIFYFDFCKAFDSVPHYRLLTKLENYGITGDILEIVRDFLSDRSLRTSVRGNYSSLREVLSGVPQGSVLGPLLFVLFINDLSDSISNITKLFADDLKLIARADNKHDIDRDLLALEEWESLWLLKFNLKKCKVMHLEFNENPDNEYLLDGVVLDNIKDEKDLGLIVSSELGWNKNIKACIKAANRAIAWISRNLIERDVTILTNVYKTIIRPKLEYCVQLWNPAACHGNWSTILELESIQRRFTRLVNDIGTLPYGKRLEQMNLTTLGERRIRGDLIETFKMVNGIVDYGKNVFRLSRSGNNIISKLKLSCNNRKISNLRSSFLPDRIKNYWNRLPKFVKLSKTVNEFKSQLDIFKNNSTSNHPHNYWEVSNLILDKIEGKNCYLSNKSKFNRYLNDNPYVAKKKGINIYVSS